MHFEGKIGFCNEWSIGDLYYKICFLMGSKSNGPVLSKINRSGTFIWIY
jgi:hypothetical protein